MEFKQIKWSEVDRSTWNQWAAQTEGATHHHSWDWINYSIRFDGIHTHESFALFDAEHKLLAMCPLAVSVWGEKKEVSFAGVPCGTPVLVPMTPSQHRKVLDHVMSIILNLAAVHAAPKIVFVSHPITVRATHAGTLAASEMFEFLRYRMCYRVHNTLVIDLENSEERLKTNLSKYQRRHIEHGQKKGLIVRAFNEREWSDQLDIQFRGIQEAHFISAGKRTRPQETWDAMRTAAHAGMGTLFVAFLGDVPVSYLYCGEFHSTAFGFSQVNVEEFEKEYSPRHLLEWEAIRFYKKRGFQFYTVGERYYGSQLFFTPTPKEITISVFKERYGGVSLPIVFWTGYRDIALLQRELAQASEEYLKYDHLIALPEV